MLYNSDVIAVQYTNWGVKKCNKRLLRDTIKSLDYKSLAVFLRILWCPVLNYNKPNLI